MRASITARAKAGRFVVSAANITPLHTPQHFYNELIQCAAKAERRIALASLYIGTGAQEQQLIRAVRRRMLDVPDLDVRIQLDYSRALRPTSTKAVKDDIAMRKDENHADAGVQGCSAIPYDSSAHLTMELLQPLRVPGKCHTESNNLQPSSMINLAPNAHVGLTLLPALRGSIAAKCLPARFVEGAGVAHIKAYLFDNTVLMSGANLSQDYFTNRQDRYVKIESGEKGGLSDYIYDLVRAMQELPGGYMLQPNGDITYNTISNDSPHITNNTHIIRPCDPVPKAEGTGQEAAQSAQHVQLDASALPKINTHSIPKNSKFDKIFAVELKKLIDNYSHAPLEGAAMHLPAPERGTAVVTPFMQLGSLDCRQDEHNTMRLFVAIPPATASTTATAKAEGVKRDSGQDTNGKAGQHTAVMHIATGYFNVTKPYMHALVEERRDTSVHILTAGPKANGFYHGHGISGAIPMAYSEILKDFVAYVSRQRRSHTIVNKHAAEPGITAYEYERKNWTFHGKGLWLSIFNGPPSPPVQPARMVTLVGSPNFGRRSIERDLELQLHVDTSEPELMSRLCAERDALFDSSADKDVEVRPVSLHLPPHNVWQQPERQIRGWSYEAGLWIHVVRRLLSAHF